MPFIWRNGFLVTQTGALVVTTAARATGTVSEWLGFLRDSTGALVIL